MNIAIIPARSGSKRIKTKNINNFLGQPVISYAINNLKKSKIFKHIFVSTNNSEIAKISINYGAEIPFFRPNSLSDDHTPIVKVIKHFIEELIKSDLNFNNVCCYFPCTPLLSLKELKLGYKLFKSQNYNYVFPALKYRHPVQRAFNLINNRKISLMFPQYESKRTQDLDTYFYDAGQFYFGKKNSWIQEKKLHSDGFFFEINPFSAIDIDDQMDWDFAETIYKLKYKSKYKSKY